MRGPSETGESGEAYDIEMMSMTHKTYPDKIDHRQENYRNVGFQDGRRDRAIWHCDCGLIFITEDPREHYPDHRLIVKREKRE